MPGKAAVFADTPTLRREGAVQGTQELGGLGPGGAPRPAGYHADTLQLQGWTFASFHDKMVDSLTLDAMHEQLCAPFPEYKMHVPPMNFGMDVMRVSHSQSHSNQGETEGEGVTVSFNAKDALAAWSAQHAPARTQSRPLQLIQVPYAKGWVERSRPHNLSPTAREVPELKEGDSGGGVDGISIDESVAHRPWDWTFSSDYCGTVSTGWGTAGEEPYAVSLAAVEAASVFDETFLSASHGLHEDTRTGVDLSLLRQRDVPILFYDEVLLYQDDLEDCGEVSFDAKLRVMPRCWFLLARMFLRIDGVIVRIRETRCVHACLSPFLSLSLSLSLFLCVATSASLMFAD